MPVRFIPSGLSLRIQGSPNRPSLAVELVEDMTTRHEHWNTIFSTKDNSELGWYEEDVSQTLKFLDQMRLPESPTVLLPGAGTSMLVDELLARGCKLVLNDISDEALNRLRGRIGTSNKLTWLHHDISKPIPEGIPVADVWIDRAVLHFLLEEADIREYFANLQSGVKPGGYVLLAEFSTKGARKCAGLELHRYSIEEMTKRIGSGFKLIKYEEYTYTSAAGDPRPYIYALYQKHR